MSFTHLHGLPQGSDLRAYTVRGMTAPQGQVEKPDKRAFCNRSVAEEAQS